MVKCCTKLEPHRAIMAQSVLVQFLIQWPQTCVTMTDYMYALFITHFSGHRLHRCWHRHQTQLRLNHCPCRPSQLLATLQPHHHNNTVSIHANCRVSFLLLVLMSVTMVVTWLKVVQELPFTTKQMQFGAASTGCTPSLQYRIYWHISRQFWLTFDNKALGVGLYVVMPYSHTLTASQHSIDH